MVHGNFSILVKLNWIYIVINLCLFLYFLFIDHIFSSYRYPALIKRKRLYKVGYGSLASARFSGSPCGASLMIGIPCAVAFGIGDGHGTSIGCYFYNVKIRVQNLRMNEFYYLWIIVDTWCHKLTWIKWLFYLFLTYTWTRSLFKFYSFRSSRHDLICKLKM